MKLIINHFYLIAVSFGYLIPVIKIHIYIHITRQHEMVKELKGQISFLLIFYHYHTGHFTFLYTSQSLKSEVLILPLYFLEASYWSNEIISVKLYKFKIIPSNSCFLNQSILPFMCIVWLMKYYILLCRIGIEVSREQLTLENIDLNCTGTLIHRFSSI